jgi:hypothetical protein
VSQVLELSRSLPILDLHELLRFHMSSKIRVGILPQQIRSSLFLDHLPVSRILFSLLISEHRVPILVLHSGLDRQTLSILLGQIILLMVNTLLDLLTRILSNRLYGVEIKLGKKLLIIQVMLMAI